MKLKTHKATAKKIKVTKGKRKKKTKGEDGEPAGDVGSPMPGIDRFTPSGGPQ